MVDFNTNISMSNGNNNTGSNTFIPDYSLAFTPFMFGANTESAREIDSIFHADQQADLVNYSGNPVQIFQGVKTLAIRVLNPNQSIQNKVKKILDMLAKDRTAAVFVLAYIRSTDPMQYVQIINKMKETGYSWEKDDANWIIQESEKYTLRGEQFFNAQESRPTDIAELSHRYNPNWFVIMNMNILMCNQALLGWNNKYLEMMKPRFSIAAETEKKSYYKNTNNNFSIFNIYAQKQGSSDSETMANIFQTFNNTIRKVFSEQIIRQGQIFLEMRARMAKELLQNLKNEQRRLEQMRVTKQVDNELLDKAVKMLQSTIEYISARRREVNSSQS